MSILDGVKDFVAWFGSLEPYFVFLLILPFLVAIAGLVGDWVRRRRERRSKPPSPRFGTHLH